MYTLTEILSFRGLRFYHNFRFQHLKSGYTSSFGGDLHFVHGECSEGTNHRADGALELPKFRVTGVFMIDRIEENLKNSTSLKDETRLGFES